MREELEHSLEFGGQGNKNKPPPKIRGSQFVKREEKIKPKLTIRNPFEGWKKKLPNQSRTPH